MTATLTEPRGRTDTVEQTAEDTAVDDLLAAVLDPSLPTWTTPNVPGARCFITSLTRFSETNSARRILEDRNARWELHLGEHAGTDAEATLLDDAKTCLTELVANAIEHAGGVTQVLIVATRTLLLAVVTDTQPIGEAFKLWPRNPAALFNADRRRMAEAGRGLSMVRALSSTWGITPVDPRTPSAGKHVWFTITRPNRA